MKTKFRGKELVVFLKGGLGNQLFQALAGVAFARKFGRTLRLSSALLPKREDSFQGVSRWPYMLGQLPSRYWAHPEPGHQPQEATSLRSKALTGLEIMSSHLPALARALGVLTVANLDSMQYSSRKTIRLLKLVIDARIVSQFLPSLRKDIMHPERPSPLFEELSSEIARDKPLILHYRSGDYENLRKVYGELSSDYFKRAFDANPGDRPVWVFTDAKDPTSLLQKLPIQSPRFVTSSMAITPIETLSLMARGSAFIGSNSTFSWWASVLGPPERSVMLPDPVGATERIANLGYTARNWIWIETR